MLPPVPIVRSLEDLNRYGGFSVPCIVIVCPLEGKPEVQVIASTPEERQSLRLDLRHDEVIHPANRFLLYALFPQARVSIHVLWGLRRQNTVFAVGRSIIDRSSQVNIGALMLSHGGGGHEAAGTCQIENDRAESVLSELVATIADSGPESLAA